MYMGHYGAALAAKGITKEAPLWLLMVASMATDIVLFGDELVGINADQVHHSLWPGNILLAIGFAIFAFALTRSLPVSAIIALVVLSHWVLDIPVAFGIYSIPWLDMLTESLLVFIGWLLYRRSIPAVSRSSWMSPTILVVLLFFQCIWFVMISI